VDEVFELFSADLSGGVPIPFVVLPGFADVRSFRLAPDGSHLLFLADRNLDEVQELFSAPLDGSTPPRRLNVELSGGRDVQDDYVALPDGGAVFRADEVDQVFELFAASVRAPHEMRSH